mmetsp:Transcript_14978/g.29918  ORF Transcript_14978/g.29918 Transcript_14978/m.29918 type:complete len:107 (-) Transcript_14978:332-652(-)
MFRTLVTRAARPFAPLGDRILVQRAVKETQTASGIYLPSSAADKDSNEGTVIAVGPGILDANGTLHAPKVAAGDAILLPEYGGTKVKLGEDEMFLFREDDILGKFD